MDGVDAKRKKVVNPAGDLFRAPIMVFSFREADESNEDDAREPDDEPSKTVRYQVLACPSVAANTFE